MLQDTFDAVDLRAVDNRDNQGAPPTALMHWSRNGRNEWAN